MLRVRGQLTFLAVPRLSRALHQLPHGSDVVVELDGSFMDHAAYETLSDWTTGHLAHGGKVETTGPPGPGSPSPPRRGPALLLPPLDPWHNHQCGEPPAERQESGETTADRSAPGLKLASGIGKFSGTPPRSYGTSWPGSPGRASVPRSSS